jgi:hypothetical protein
MEAQRDYPIETFDPLLRDLVGWRLVERQDGSAGTPWQLVSAAQRRLDELFPTEGAGARAVVYLDRHCADCHQRGLTRLEGESYLCDSCSAQRQEQPQALVTEPAPAEQAHFWRRSRPSQTTPLAG